MSVFITEDMLDYEIQIIEHDPTIKDYAVCS